MARRLRGSVISVMNYQVHMHSGKPIRREQAFHPLGRCPAGLAGLLCRCLSYVWIATSLNHKRLLTAINSGYMDLQPRVNALYVTSRTNPNFNICCLKKILLSYALNAMQRGI